MLASDTRKTEILQTDERPRLRLTSPQGYVFAVDTIATTATRDGVRLPAGLPPPSQEIQPAPTMALCYDCSSGSMSTRSIWALS